MKTKNQVFLGLILVIFTSSAIHSQVDFKCLQGNCENGTGKAVYYFEDTTIMKVNS